MNKTVSIALATFNGSRFLRQQLDSIYGQSCKVFGSPAPDVIEVCDFDLSSLYAIFLTQASASGSAKVQCMLG